MEEKYVTYCNRVLEKVRSPYGNDFYKEKLEHYLYTGSAVGIGKQLGGMEFFTTIMQVEESYRAYHELWYKHLRYKNGRGGNVLLKKGRMMSYGTKRHPFND